MIDAAESATHGPETSVIDHVLVPHHELLSPEEAKALVEGLKAKPEQFPKIFASDPAIRHLSPKVGEIVKITRNSATAGTATYYRLVIESDEVLQGEE